MASQPLNEKISSLILLYKKGELTVDELRELAFQQLEPDQVEAFVRLLPADALVRLSGWEREGGGDHLIIGTFSRLNDEQEERPASIATREYLASCRQWVSTLDVERAVELVRTDAYQDWYRDPWGWPELDFLLGAGREHLLARALTGPVPLVSKLEVPKDAFQNRPAVLLDVTDRVLYQACVDTIADKAQGRLRPWVFGWQPSKSGRSLNLQQWRAYQSHIHESADTYKQAWKSDITEFFASATIQNVERLLRGYGASRELELVVRQLETLPETTARSGLPQRAMASSMIANLILAQVDIDVEAERPQAEFARWLDDTWVFSHSSNDLQSAATSISEGWRSLGFSVNQKKTRFLEGKTLAEAVARIDMDYIDYSLSVDSNANVLEEAVDVVLQHIGTATRHELSYVTSRIKQYHRNDLAERIAESRDQLVHVADLVVPLLLKFGLWRDLLGWFTDLLEGESIPWVKATYCRMFPRNEHWPKMLIQTFLELGQNGDQDDIVRITALSRMSKVCASDAHDIAMREIRTTESPTLRRALAFVGVKAGIPRSQLRRALLQDDRTIVVAELLKHGQYSDKLLTIRT